MQENWNTRGLILEGICGSGKTSILKELSSSDRFIKLPYLSTVIMSEHQTQRVLELKERQEGLSKEDNLVLLNQHVDYLQKITYLLDNMQWCEGGRVNMRLPFLLERFHLTHVCHYKHMQWEDVQDIDKNIAALDCRLCLFTINREQMIQRIINRPNAAWQQYIKRYGNTPDEIIEYYAEQQEYFLKLSKNSALPVLIIDTSNTNASDIIGQIFDFWGIT